MARITITTDQGQLIGLIDDDNIGDYETTLNRFRLLDEITDAIAQARRIDAAEQATAPTRYPDQGL